MTVDTDTDTDTGEQADEDEREETPADADPEPEQVDDALRRRRRRVRLLRGAAAGLVIVAVLIGTGLLGWSVWQHRELARASTEAQQAAVRYAEVLTSVDSGKIDQNFNDVLNGATGEFKDMYTQASVQLRQLLLDNKASAHGVVVESAVQSATTDKVVVLLFVDQSITNANVPDPRIDRSRVKITMDKVDGRWRASKVELP